MYIVEIYDLSVTVVMLFAICRLVDDVLQRRKEETYVVTYREGPATNLTNERQVLVLSLSQ